MLLHNQALVVQNAVSVRDIGAASSNVAFFRTFGGAVGVSVLGAVLATRVEAQSSVGLANLGVSSEPNSGG